MAAKAPLWRIVPKRLSRRQPSADRFLAPDNPGFNQRSPLLRKPGWRGEHMLRHAAEDDLASETAFNVCTFWLIDMCQDLVGRDDEAWTPFTDVSATGHNRGYCQKI
jgi:hypothetical protein